MSIFGAKKSRITMSQRITLGAITQETLAEMIGTTRSRVSHFMNRFRQHGFIENNGRIRYTSHSSM
jgi:predicted XRE-type DNA-binding protein